LRLVEEAQTQNETALRPIVALTLQHKFATDESGRAASESRTLQVRNLGNGPAFNVTIEHLSGDGDAKYVFFHPDTLAKDESAVVYVGEFDGKTPFVLGWDALEEVIFGHEAISLPQMISINFQSATGKPYHTAQRLDGDAPDTLRFEFHRSGAMRLPGCDDEGVRS
jgi:hypothetical protein